MDIEAFEKSPVGKLVAIQVEESGDTPFCIAAFNGHLEVIRLLCDAGANKDQATEKDQADKDGEKTAVCAVALSSR